MTAFIMLFQNFQEKHLMYHCISQARERQNQQVVYTCIKKKTQDLLQGIDSCDCEDWSIQILQIRQQAGEPGVSVIKLESKRTVAEP